MTEVEELKVKLEEQKERIELLKTMMQNLGDISKSEKAKEYFTLLQNKSTISLVFIHPSSSGPTL